MGSRFAQSALIDRRSLQSRWLAVIDQIRWLLVGIIGLCLFAILYQRGYDDPYITYRYAHNLAHGFGFVYNPDTPTLSTTAPLFGLILTPIAMLGWSLPLAANLLGCLSHAAGALALLQLGRQWDDTITSGSAALLYILFPLPLSTLGSETLPAIALTLWVFVWAARGQQVLTGLLMGVLVWLRPDGILVGPLALLLLLTTDNNWRHPRRWPWPAAMIWIGIVLAGMGLAWVVYGRPLPVTLYAKQQQALIPGFYDFGDRLWVTLTAHLAQPLYQIIFALAILGLIVSIRSWRWLLLPGWAALYGMTYTWLHVAGYFWYVAPLVIGLAPLFGLSVRFYSDWLRRIGGMRFMVIGVIVLVGGTTLWLGSSVYRLGQQIDPRLTVYRTAGEWLAANTSPTDSVATLEIGIIGYYAQRPMIDFAGLLQPDIAARLGPGGFGEAALYAIDQYRPAYLVLQEQALPLLPSRPDLAKRCLVVAEIPDPRYPTPLTIHACRWEE